MPDTNLKLWNCCSQSQSAARTSPWNRLEPLISNKHIAHYRPPLHQWANAGWATLYYGFAAEKLLTTSLLGSGTNFLPIKSFSGFWCRKALLTFYWLKLDFLTALIGIFCGKNLGFCKPLLRITPAFLTILLIMSLDAECSSTRINLEAAIFPFTVSLKRAIKL